MTPSERARRSRRLSIAIAAQRRVRAELRAGREPSPTLRVLARPAKFYSQS